jgi:hypothetical protein
MAGYCTVALLYHAHVNLDLMLMLVYRWRCTRVPGAGGTVIWIVVSYSYVCTILRYPGTCLGSRTWPPLHLDAVVAMRSESRAGPRAMATVIYCSTVLTPGY